MPGPIDFVFAFVLVVVLPVAEHVWFWPRFRRRAEAGDPEVRRWGYRRGIVGQWTLVAVLVGIWLRHDRTLADLRLAVPAGWRLATSVALVALMLAFVIFQVASLRTLTPERRVAAKAKFGSVGFLLPHTRAEYRWFLLLSLTAGVCEELIYRGYLVWFLQPWLGLAGAYVGVVVLFGVGHLYQGRSGATRATLAGAVLTGFVALTGWLVPAMIVHALVDAGSGTVGHAILRDDVSTETPAASPDAVAALG